MYQLLLKLTGLLLIPLAVEPSFGVLNNIISSLKPTSGSADAICADETCKEPLTLPVTFDAVVKLTSPFYLTYLSRNNKSETIDNCCYTYFEVQGSRFLLWLSCVFNDGTSVQYSSFEENSPQLGVLRSGNPECIFTEYTFALTPCSIDELVYNIYRCFGFGSIDMLIGLSPKSNNSELCKDLAIAEARKSGIFRNNGFVKMPQKHPYQCVTKYGDNPCINVDKIPAEYAISKP